MILMKKLHLLPRCYAKEQYMGCSCVHPPKHRIFIIPRSAVGGYIQ